jgi:hypothetical protein
MNLFGCKLFNDTEELTLGVADAAVVSTMAQEGGIADVGVHGLSLLG